METETSLYVSALEEYASDNISSSLKLFTSLTEKYPNNSLYLIGAISCELKLSHYEKAIELLSKTEKIEKNSFRVNYLTGIALFKSKKYVEAKIAFSSALQQAKDPDEKRKITIWSSKTDIQLREQGVIDFNSQNENEVKVITNWMQSATEVTVELTANKSLNGYEAKFENKAIRIIRAHDNAEKCVLKLTNS